MTPQEFLQFLCKQQQQSLLARFCFTLMTGYLNYPTTEEYDAHTNSQIFASHVTVDVIWRGANPKFVGHTTHLFDFSLDFSGEKNKRATMSSYRIATTVKNLRYRPAMQTIQAIFKGVPIGLHDFIIISADNIQFLDKPVGAYAHWFTLLYHIIPEEVVRSWGAYDASRQRNLGWYKNKTDDELVDRYLQANDSYWAMLDGCFMLQKQLLLECMAIEMKPSTAECKEMSEHGTFEWQKGLPIMYRFTMENDLPDAASEDHNLLAMREKARKAEPRSSSRHKQQCGTETT
jgi:hypothetical protein